MGHGDIEGLGIICLWVNVNLVQFSMVIGS